MRRLTLAFAWVAVFTIGGAQTQTPVFEVASVKPSQSLEPRVNMGPAPGGGFDAVNVPLQMLITYAYDVRDHQLIAAPGWLMTERYDIQAKAPADGSRSQDSVRQRLQSLLAERFKLVAHRDTRQMPLYELVVSKNGHRLQLWKEADEHGPQIIGRG